MRTIRLGAVGALLLGLLTVLGSAPADAAGVTDWRSVSAGATYTCGIRTNTRLYCWGWNGEGQLGDGTTDAHVVPTEVAGGTTGWVSVSTGTFHTCARRSTGRLYCWGTNSGGQLGDGTTTDRLVPTEVAGARTDWASVSVGYSHTCARTTTSRLYCWGDNVTGQLGDGTLTQRHTPTQVAGATTDWTTVAASQLFTCARKRTGRLYCWGENNVGQLGDATTTERHQPTQVAGASTAWTSFAPGDRHVCARQSTGRLYCWGSNNHGQVGDTASAADHLTPKQVNGKATTWAAVTAGENHTCARRTNGRLYCWGYDFNGQLGHGGGSETAIPAQVSGARTDWTKVDAGATHTCARQSSGRLFCWGDNARGEIGDGTFGTDRPTPVEVAAP